MITIISWNVNGLRAAHKKGNLQEVFQMKPDILCIQETKALPDQLPPELKDPEGYHSYFHFPTVKKGYSGVAIYSREKPLKVTRDLGVEAYDQEGRLIMAEYKNFILINTYFPNGGGAPERLRYKLDFYDYFLEFIDRLSAHRTGADGHKKPILFCGDLNVAHKPIDLARPRENETHIGFLPIERAWIDKVISHGWVDVFRHFYPDKTEAYTYWDMKSFARDRNVGWRIDYFFASPEAAEKIKSIEILDKVLGSDHCPVKVVL